ncbi:hypothetical protein [Bradyrhizobium sp. Leo170]|uniref:hypothetical protein n=1 Tax=Bradyrhizobium sp. Leo170 TaxID=1571199 RepID=UPI00102E8096|nr:hypothetical protein [Bradyrhizobium sp. Leo170]
MPKFSLSGMVPEMVRLILIVSVALALAAGAGQAQQGAPRKGSPQKLERCKQLATERGFSSAGGQMKGQGRAKKEFVIACMQGKQS